MNSTEGAVPIYCTVNPPVALLDINLLRIIPSWLPHQPQASVRPDPSPHQCGGQNAPISAPSASAV